MADLDRDEVVRLYVDEFTGLQVIARRLGTNQVHVAWILGTAGIPLRSKSEALTGRTKSPEHRAKLVESLKKARAHIGPDANDKRRKKMKGREPPNKGKPMSEKQRQTLIAQRSTHEYREAAAERQRGEKSHLWRGGKIHDEELHMQGWEWRQRRKECYERDRWLCQDCGAHCRNGTRIQAHHIIGRRYGGTDELDNLVTLCASCHRKREMDTRAKARPRQGAR